MERQVCARSSGSDYTIRVMTPGDLDRVIEWAAAEAWNPGVNDAACFRAADPDGFLAGVVDGRLAAAISAVRYGAGFGFIGFYIVDPDLRQRGYGLRIWQAALQHLGERRTIGLDGVVAQQANYAKSCLLYTSPSPRDGLLSRMPSSA